MDDLEVSTAIGGLVPVAENVWIFDDAPINAGGLRLPVRMTVLRLANGDLLLHSPTRFSLALRQQLEIQPRCVHIRRDCCVAPTPGGTCSGMAMSPHMRTIVGA
jgi:hypothetical protein